MNVAAPSKTANNQLRFKIDIPMLKVDEIIVQSNCQYSDNSTFNGNFHHNMYRIGNMLRGERAPFVRYWGYERT